jgi:hypothetical protein
MRYLLSPGGELLLSLKRGLRLEAGGGRGKTLGEERIDPQISQITQIRRKA